MVLAGRTYEPRAAEEAVLHTLVRQHLCRYMLRPPVAQDRLHLLGDGRVVVTLKSEWADGTTHLLFEPLKLLERLAALTPRPRINLVLYQGVLAPHSCWRDRVVGSLEQPAVPDLPVRSGSLQHRIASGSGIMLHVAGTMLQTMPKVLVVDDEPLTCSFLTDALKSEGFQVAIAGDALGALDQVTSDPPAVVILDLRLPGVDGIEALRKLKEIAPPLPVIILTGYGDIASAVETMRLGAYDYLTKPVHLEKILVIVRRALEGGDAGGQIEGLREKLRRRGKLPWLLGGSREIQQVIEQVRQVAVSTFTVLVQGETGTGKELVARSIHERSVRRDHPFVALDCGAIPDTLIESELFGYEKGAFTGAERRKEGHFQLAAGGTLFLDEIVNLPLTTQAKLLRTLQERQIQVLGGKGPLSVDVRIIAASNVPLEKETRAGRFRQDLYYRLTEFIIVVPPLRERREDIVYLANRFIAEAAMELRRQVRGISDEAVRVLLEYPWPGNVRELRNVVRRAVLLSSDLIRPEHLLLRPPDSLRAPAIGDLGAWPVGSSLREMATMAAADVERRAIRQALLAARGNKSEAARILRTDFKTLHLKMKSYGIDAREFVEP